MGRVEQIYFDTKEELLRQAHKVIRKANQVVPAEIPKPPVDKVLLSMPTGYGAYCVFVPLGWNQPFEQDIIELLDEWMKKSGKKLNTTTLGIKDNSYVELMKAVGLRKGPFLMLAPENEIKVSTFKVVLDDPNLMKDIEQLKTLLPQLLDLILMGEFRDAAKKALCSGRKRDLKRILSKKVEKLAKNFKVTFSIFGITISLKTD